MQKISVLLLFFAMTCPLQAVGNYLVNGTMSELNQQDTPAGWMIQSGCWRTLPDGVELSPDPEKPGKVSFVQMLKLPLDSWLKVGAKVTAPTGTRFRIYVEHHTAEKEPAKRKYGSSGAVWMTGDGTEQLYSRTFQVKIPYAYCYVAVQTDGTAPVTFRGLFVEQDKSLQCLGGKWRVAPPHQLNNGEIECVGRKGMVTIQDIPVRPGAHYRLEYEARGLDEAKTVTGFHEIQSRITPSVNGSFAFNDVGTVAQRKFQIFTVPKESNVHNIAFSLQVANEGKVLFRDFTLEEIPVDPTADWSLRLDTPFYRNLIFASDKDRAVAGTILADATAARGKLTLILPDGSHQECEISFTNATAAFHFSPWSGTPGDGELTAEVVAQDGRCLRRFTEHIRWLEPLEQEVKAHPNGYFTHNGQWIFPICKWGSMSVHEQEVYFLARQGFNVVKTNFDCTPRRMLERLDMAHRNGLRVFIHSGCPRSESDVPRHLERVHRLFIPSILAHPAFMGHFLVDEPLWAGLSHKPLRAVYEDLRELDPGHPVWINAAPRNEISDLRPYGECCDIYGVDIYPVPWPNSHSALEDKTPSSCGKYAARMAEVVYGRKPIWDALQGFAWHECTNDRWKPEAVKPYPTLTQARFMAYDTLLSGGTGYGLWGMDYIQHNEFYEVCFQVTRELSAMSAPLLHGVRHELTTSESELRAVQLTLEGKCYYIILNMSEKPVKGSVHASVKDLRDYASGAAVDFTSISLDGYGVITCGASLPPPVNPLPESNADFDRMGSPFPALIQKMKAEALAKKYDGSAKWIWDATTTQPGGSCQVVKVIDVPNTTVGSSVRFASDDFATLYVNGEKILDWKEGWNWMADIDLTPCLRKGRNVIAILGQDAGALPCGILAEIQVGAVCYPTDESWRTFPKNDDQSLLPAAAELDKGRPAAIIAPYGGGAWGRNVRMK